MSAEFDWIAGFWRAVLGTGAVILLGIGMGIVWAIVESWPRHVDLLRANLQRRREARATKRRLRIEREWNPRAMAMRGEFGNRGR